MFLGAAGSGYGGEELLTTGLHVTVTNVGWHGAGNGPWNMVGAHVDVDCELQEMVVRAEDVERSSEPSVNTVCEAIRSDSGLLRASATAPACSDYDYFKGTVYVTGTWQGRRIDLTFPTCEYEAGYAPVTDPGARWAHLLGFHFQGPEVPA
jgi:hypothetical protein